MSIDRHGINKGNIGPLAKCSFEETTDQLLKAAVFGKTDNINGVSSNIMLGQIAPCGTGIPQILVDEVKLMDIYKDYDFSKYSKESSKNKSKQVIDDSQLSDDLASEVNSQQDDQDENYDSDLDEEEEDLQDMLSFDFNPELNKDMNTDFIQIN